MITNSKDNKEQILSFGEEYWHRSIKDKEDYEQDWNDWKKIDASEYFAYLQLFTNK